MSSTRLETNQKNDSSESLNSTALVSHFRPKDEYQHLKDFDEGEEGQCSIVKSRTTGRMYVVKHTLPVETASPDKNQKTGRRRPLPNEAKMLQRLQGGPNIVRFLGVEPSPLLEGRHFIFTELCTGGDLLEQLQEFRKLKMPTPEILTLHVLVSVAQALAYIHHGLRRIDGKGFITDSKHVSIVHGDIKPDNIFLRWPATECGLPDIILADFGLASIASESHGITGTPGYDPPEVRIIAALRHVNPVAYKQKNNGRIMTAKSDVYQLGVVLYLMAKRAFWNDIDYTMARDPATIDLPPRYLAITGFLAMLCWCLQPIPADRPECTYNPIDGMLDAVDMFRRKRDAMCASNGPLDEEIWRVCKVTGA
ncbi:hypothetical protein LTR37_005972 [Vermiconidia calcicola]|uniref:Uncharacterized protein n=1 Tax=Vermiconidia calcicola TaxID=1690605 RepID=A0ACC3NJ68_9PEZI|nr:hypothetical protein LTR37_005972 [Vermiconidia calcicola]